jgi:3-methyladenine DNA glycosylase AlkD
MQYKVSEVLNTLRSQGSARNVAGMARFGITSFKAFGVSGPRLHRLAHDIGKDHELALRLWSTNFHEARAVAALIADPGRVTKSLMNSWVKEFDNWAICDCTCCYLFDKTPLAVEMAIAWSKRKEEFVKRAGFVVMAALAVHEKKTTDATFLKFLTIIERGSTDERNFVKKAINWALRQIGKRNLKLNAAAIRAGVRLRKSESPAARWIAADALRELKSAPVQKRLRNKGRNKI